MTGAFNWIRFSAFVPAILAGGLGFASQVLLGVPRHAAPIAALTLSTFAIYQLDRMLALDREDRVAHPARSIWTTRRRGLLKAALVVAVLGAVLLGYPVAMGTPLGVILAGGVGIAYGVSLSREGRRLKDIRWLKPVIVAGVWACVVGFLVIPLNSNPPESTYLLVAYRFFYLLANVFVCDLIEGGAGGDAGSGGTASAFGPVRVIGLARLSAGIAVVLGILLSMRVPNPTLAMIDVAGVALLMALTHPKWLPQIRDSIVVDVATLWPVVTALVASMVVL